MLIVWLGAGSSSRVFPAGLLLGRRRSSERTSVFGGTGTFEEATWDRGEREQAFNMSFVYGAFGVALIGIGVLLDSFSGSPQPRQSSHAHRQPPDRQAEGKPDGEVHLEADDSHEEGNGPVPGSVKVAQQQHVQDSCCREHARQDGQREGCEKPREARAQREREE